MASTLDNAGSLEVVYYGSPVPRNGASLTFLGLLFDRIHFPNVYLPRQGFDLVAAIAERERIENLDRIDYSTAILINVMTYLEMAEQLKDVCYFTGEKGQVCGGADMGAAAEIVAVLNKIMFPVKETSLPIGYPGSYKGLPCGEHIDYPGPLYYPANALIYAARHGLPVVNDQPGLPVPALGGDEAKYNAKLLSTILAIECASLVLPKIRPLHPQELVEARAELKQYLGPFRLALLRVAAELNSAIEHSSSHQEIMKAAKFMVETSVVPHLVELRSAVEKPNKPWYSRAFDLAKQVPELTTSFATMPVGLFAAKALGTIGGFLVDADEGQRKKQAARSGMYYLLKLKEVGEAEKEK